MTLALSYRLSSRISASLYNNLFKFRRYHFASIQNNSLLKASTFSYFDSVFFSNLRYYSSDSKKDTNDSNRNATQQVESIVQDAPSAKITQGTRLKQAIRDYGATIVVFHVAISLTSLGLCYVAISNGVDATRFLMFLGFSESIISSKVAVGGSTFVIAYAVHKVFAPARIAITLSVAPFIVRYLRKVNWLKPPQKKV